MNDLFLLWLSLSLSGSLVAVALFLLRPVLRNFSKTWQYYLWLLVILRLLVPFSPGLSLVGGLFQQAETHFAAQYAPSESLRESSPTGHAPGLTQNPTDRILASPVFFSGQEYHMAGVLRLAGFLWLVVSPVFLFRRVYGYLRLVKAVRRESEVKTEGQLPAVLRKVCTEMGVRKTFCVCTNPMVRAPMIVGIIRPMIVLPDRTVTLPELNCIFRHELTHYRRMDVLYKWLVEIAVCLHWFNPLVYAVRRKISRDCELSCDEAVIAGLEQTQRLTYGDTLLHSIAVSHDRSKDYVSLSLNKDGRLIKERLCAIMKYRRQSKGTVLIAVVFTSLLFCGTVTAGAYTMTGTGHTLPVAKHIAGASVSRMPVPAAPGRPDEKTPQTVVYNSVEMRRYEGESGHPYIHEIMTNSTFREITGYQRGMLAFDREGNPLKIDWLSLDTELDREYLNIYETDSVKIAPGETCDEHGGWSLNVMGNDQTVADIAYVLYCNKQITFSDGTLWENPDFENWRAAYEGKKTDPDILESYYPYEYSIVFNSGSASG